MEISCSTNFNFVVIHALFPPKFKSLNYRVHKKIIYSKSNDENIKNEEKKTRGEYLSGKSKIHYFIVRGDRHFLTLCITTKLEKPNMLL